MSSHFVPPDSERDLKQLLAEEPFVRALARKLAFDEADDVVQQTWLHAIRRSQPAIGTPRRWLAQVVRRIVINLRRSDRRREQRNELVQQPALVPTSAELLEREERRRALIAAVDALPPSQRSVVLLRYFEGLSPRQIGEQLGLSSTTVSTLLARGLTALRGRLDLEHDGDRRAWLLPLIAFGPMRSPLPMPEPIPALPVLMTGVVAMTMKTKLVAVLAILVVTATAWVWWHADQVPLAIPTADRAASPPSSAVAPGPAVQAVEGSVDVGTTVREIAATETGDSRIVATVVWAEDGSPAAEVQVNLYLRGSTQRYAPPLGYTDASGVIEFSGLAPGRYTPASVRGDHNFGEVIELAAGQRVDVRLEVPVGLTARGRVVDSNGLAVSHADLVASDWGGGTTQWLGRCAADGTFELRGVGTTCHLGARKAGYRPSSMRTFTTEAGAKVELTIMLEAGGGRLTGTVLDPSGAPIADAGVRAGSTEQNNHKLPDGAAAMGPQCEEVRTDANGCFVFASVVPGNVPVAVRAPGLAPWSQDVAVEVGGTSDITVHLLAGSSVLGTVKNQTGEPVAGAEIRIGGWDAFSGSETRSDADGSFRLDGLGVGAVEAVAETDQRAVAKASLDLVAGAEQRWDPVLSSGLQLRGRCVDSEGKPVAKVTVEAQLDHWLPGDRWHGHAVSDAAGKFVIANCLPDRAMKLTVRRKSVFPELAVEGVTIGVEELVVRMPEPAWAYMEGTVRGADGETLANVNLSPHLIEGGSGSPVETLDPTTGAFKIGPYPPGHYALNILADGYPRLRIEHTLLANETWQLGALRLVRGGTLAMQVVSDDVAVATQTASIYEQGGAWITNVKLEQGAGHSEPLVPGNYELLIKGEDASALLPFAIRQGIETSLDVPLTRGNKVTVVCEGPNGTKLKGRVQLVVRHPDGRTAWRSNIYRSADAYSTTFWLPPGTYRIEATCANFTNTADLTVPTKDTTHLTLSKS